MICRICLSDISENDCIPIKDCAVYITVCTTVKIEDDDLLPKFVCKPCCDKARNAYAFKVLCEESDLKLRQDHEKIKEDCSSTSKSKEKLKCHNCDTYFQYKKPLIKHEQKHEEGFTCKDCGKDYASAKHLAIHVNVKKRKGSHLCHLCGKAYTLPENLKRHQRVHDNVRPFSCDVCKKRFTQSNELKSHLISHSSEKKFLCSFCGHKYARENSLQVHIMRIHTNMSKPHVCNLCGRTFKGLVDMRIHRSIHSGVKNHICKVCNKGFNKRSNLKVHEMIHTGQRPFVCHICQKSFIQKHVLNKHLSVHSENTSVPVSQ